MNAASWSLAITLGTSALCAGAGDELYRVNSRDVGWNGIDLTITETRREGRISHVSVPHYSNRTSVESRFAMCAYTDMAIQRKFAAWAVSETDGDEVLVGFLVSEDEDVATALGPRFTEPHVLKASVRVINRMCGISTK